MLSNKPFLILIEKLSVTLFFLVIIVITLTTIALSSTIIKKVKKNLIKSTVQTSNTDIQPAKPEVFNPKVLGWIPYWDQRRAVEVFKKNAELFDYISFFWYGIDKDGNIRTYKSTVEDQKVINYAHQKNVKVFAVIANLPDYDEGGDWDFERVNKVINNQQSRQNHIQNILDLLLSRNLDGVDIDYEALKSWQRENFSLFIEELGNTLHQNRKLLGVAIHPKTSENNPSEDNGSRAQDLERISKVIDHLYFMTYEQHNKKTLPGPIAAIDWVEKVVNYALRDLKIPQSKLFLGIPLYGYDWKDNNISDEQTEELEFTDVEKLILVFKPTVQFNNLLGEPFFHYVKDGQDHTVWFSNAQSVSTKLNLAKKYEVGGLGLWKLGREDPKIWQYIKQIKKNRL